MDENFKVTFNILMSCLKHILKGQASVLVDHLPTIILPMKYCFIQKYFIWFFYAVHWFVAVNVIVFQHNFLNRFSFFFYTIMKKLYQYQFKNIINNNYYYEYHYYYVFFKTYFKRSEMYYSKAQRNYEVKYIDKWSRATGKRTKVENQICSKQENAFST